MLVALCTLPGKEDELPRLCVIPDKLIPGVTSVNLEHVQVTESAIHYLSPDEGFVIRSLEDGFKELEPLLPAVLYLTPNLPSRPGFSVSKVKFKFIGDNRYQVFFDRAAKGWEQWRPHLKVY